VGRYAVGALFAALAFSACDARTAKSSAQSDSALDSSRPAAAPTTRPVIEAATLDRARQSIADFLQANVVNARGDAPALDLCYQAPAFKETASLLAIARARVLDVQPAASVHGPRADSLSVLAELLVVTRGRRSGDGWVVEKNTQLDTVRLTLVPATHLPGAQWALCWSGYASKEFTGTPVFLRLGDSTAVEGLEWKPPMHSWASLARLADSVRWSSLESLRNDTAVARTKATGTFADRLGVLQSARDGQWCLTIADSTLPAGTPLLVVSPARPQAAGPGLIESRRARACTTPGDEWGSVSLENASYYQVALAPGRSVADPAIVVAGQTTVLRSKAGVVAADVDRDGALELFESCTSSEGIHLRVSTGSGAGSIERWHQYFYVPYTLEPTCNP
jgi:hypothetical protein